MDDMNETTRILNAETTEQLIKMRNEEISKILKLRLILKELKNMKLSALNLQDTKQLEIAQKVLRIGEYMHLNEKEDDLLLNLRDIHNVTLSYTERKAVRKYLLSQLPITLQPIADFGEKIRKELPEIFVKSTDDASNTTFVPESQVSHSSTAKPDINALQQIAALESQRRKDYEKLATLRQRKCMCLKTAADLKLGPYLSHELELIYSQAKMNQIKANVLRSFFINQYVTSTEHTLKAIKEVNGYVDEAVDKIEQGK